MRELLAGLVPGLPASALASIVARADGIPLYAVETVRMLLAEGRLILEGGVYRPVGDLTTSPCPETLTALIASRLDALDAGRPGARRGRGGPRPELHPGRARRGVRASRRRSSNRVLRALVRRELLVQDVDPRTPERGQYSFVQALIREVAYNTLARRDRKIRHLAAARFFESLGTDELAGALAEPLPRGARIRRRRAEADALAAQARIALRGAAERAAALGVARAGDRLPRAGPRSHQRRRPIGPSSTSGRWPPRGRASFRRLRSDTRRAPSTPDANSAIGRASRARSPPSASIGVLRNRGRAGSSRCCYPRGRSSRTSNGHRRAWLMQAIASGYAHQDDRGRIAWLERPLPVAEGLDLLRRRQPGWRD